MLPGFLGRTQPDRMAAVSLLWEAVCLISYLHRGGGASNVGDKGATSRPLSLYGVWGGLSQHGLCACPVGSRAEWARGSRFPP